MLRFSLKEMVLRKITIDYSVRYIPQSGKQEIERVHQTREGLIQFFVNKTKIFHKIVRNSLKML